VEARSAPTPPSLGERETHTPMEANPYPLPMERTRYLPIPRERGVFVEHTECLHGGVRTECLHGGVFVEHTECLHRGSHIKQIDYL